MTAVQPQPDIKGYVRYLATEAAEKALSPNVRRLGVETLTLLDTVERLTAERDIARAAQIALEQELAVKDEALAELRALHEGWEQEAKTWSMNAEEPIMVGLLRSAVQVERILSALAARLDARLHGDEEGEADE